jgi:hypothetical protein
MNMSLIVYGLAGWAAATVALRIGGQRLLHPDEWGRTLVLFALSFPLMAWLIRRLCRSLHLRREQWPAAAVSILLPTLLLDPFSSAFFPLVFPNIAPEMAGVFGGWMLWCCAGALVGVTVGRHTPS